MMAIILAVHLVKHMKCLVIYESKQYLGLGYVEIR